MDDFSVFGDSYEGCLENLWKVLERCQQKNLVLNWEKCHFMLTQGIVLGHIVLKKRNRGGQSQSRVDFQLTYPYVC